MSNGNLTNGSLGNIGSFEDSDDWYTELTAPDYLLLIGLPIGTLLFIYILLRIIWKPKSTPKFKLPAKNAATYGTTNMVMERKQSSSKMEAGQVAGAYIDEWLHTFDLILVVGMSFLLVLLIVLTFLFQPKLYNNLRFWISLIPKIAAMTLVSLIGGLICRHYSIIDELGYVINTTTHKFKIDYTKKLQHFAAYIIPLILKPPKSSHPLSLIELAWCDYVTLLSLLILIKPLRERSNFIMLQFNSLDRPQDRPHSLKWIIAGTLLPGLVVVLIFRWLFSFTNQGNLVFTIIFIAGVGNGLAEPVGMLIGKHTYEIRSCFSSRTHTRTWEGSACVFLAAMIFPALQYRDFTSSTQVLLSMLLIPPITTYVEAIAPDKMDTPILMTLTGFLLLGIIHFTSN